MAEQLSPEQQRRLGALLEVTPVATELGERFRASAHDLFLVGGWVRDALLGRPGEDLDFATDARPEETVRILRGWADRQYLTGVRFGTVDAAKDEHRMHITTFREESYPSDDRHPAVAFVGDLEADLSRRDFTINAMAVRVPGGEFVDPFGGLMDLAHKRIATPLEPRVSFEDDPLRMLRAARFASSLEATPSREVVEAIADMRDRLEIVSPERIQGELNKLLISAKPSRGLELVVETGLADVFLPELPGLRLEQDPVHRHKDVFRHTLAVIERCEADLTLRLAALFHDVGKPKTRQFTSDGVQFHHHEVVGARMAEERLRALRYPERVIADVVHLVEMHLRFHTYRMGWSDGAVRRYVRDAGHLLDPLNQLVRADCTTRNPFKARALAALQDELEERVARLAEEENLARIRPPLDGNEVMERLGIGPSRQVGEALAYLLDVRMDRGPLDHGEAVRLLEEWATERGLRA
ncbi:MAG: CCA tRNA nucleotidyltransferase [Actinobacteria bacterium]|nr:CCA tRNA nucleotidyltransferase [Actinomycetota bacterium]